jgi:hypothetical protein
VPELSRVRHAGMACHSYACATCERRQKKVFVFSNFWFSGLKVNYVLQCVCIIYRQACFVHGRTAPMQQYTDLAGGVFISKGGQPGDAIYENIQSISKTFATSCAPFVRIFINPRGPMLFMPYFTACCTGLPTGVHHWFEFCSLQVQSELQQLKFSVDFAIIQHMRKWETIHWLG